MELRRQSKVLEMFCSYVYIIQYNVAVQHKSIFIPCIMISKRYEFLFNLHKKRSYEIYYVLHDMFKCNDIH